MGIWGNVAAKTVEFRLTCTLNIGSSELTVYECTFCFIHTKSMRVQYSGMHGLRWWISDVKTSRCLYRLHKYNDYIMKCSIHVDLIATLIWASSWIQNQVIKKLGYHSIRSTLQPDSQCKNGGKTLNWSSFIIFRIHLFYLSNRFHVPFDQKCFFFFNEIECLLAYKVDHY